MNGLTAPVEQAYDKYKVQAERWLQRFEARGGRVFCGAGCFGCCNMPIRLNLAEAMIVHEGLSPAKRQLVREHAAKVMRNARSARSEDEYVSRHRLEVGYCPLLDRENGRCSEYELRPTRCRDTYSALPPVWCEEGYFESQSPAEQAAYARTVARTPGTDGELHYIAPLEHLSEPIWEKAAAAMDRAFGLQVWGDFWVLVSLSGDEEFLFHLKKSDAPAAWKRAKSLGLAHAVVLEIFS